MKCWVITRDGIPAYVLIGTQQEAAEKMEKLRSEYAADWSWGMQHAPFTIRIKP
jgi:hypothetical protein